mmetsp:Transcript_11570/g.24406  ORF Transcript_11570/g.24406 Transcript_11570/m.24406 type:complete len:211 (+) Transcript_11570:143-775(+)|eukprot:CAMPEP_0171352662 /NCGR_PEP_ID=MMETSP0878-20121228/42232_1 /TAXON_ID=67004 /ORGANISM="Thalassiosira weissflogii, Strain CCMP1336" /LENGTH=210 /DNA_ID=CAMNT_0011858379 /DNA_START=116 /DNA_END=748 /DNA_ORIENTATION=+
MISYSTSYAVYFLAVGVLLLAAFQVQSFSPSPKKPSQSSSRRVSSAPQLESPILTKKAGPVILEIGSPSDLKNFVDIDDRVSVIKVYANWCKTCKAFDPRFRKVACTWGTVNGPMAFQTEYSDTVRFAQMEYEANEEICQLLDATKLPYILVYKRKGGKIAGFTCPPNKVGLLTNVLHEHALPTDPSAFHSLISDGVETSEFISDDEAFR